MALTMESAVPPAQDTDLMDIDIDMDMDDNVAAIDDEFQLEEGEEPSFVPSSHIPVQDNSALIPAIYTEDPALEPQWNKIHIRGVDDFHTNDILGFVHDHFSDVGDDVHVQWVDDTSANICFKDNGKAKQAQLAFLANPITEEELTNMPFELRSTKPLASRPGSMLVVRVAQQGDRKKKNARDASRYYLLHPDQDPTERMRSEFANSRGDYRRRRFDDRELYRRRRDNDAGADPTDFSANMYDDAPAATTDTETAGRGRDLFSRVTKGRGRGRSASPSRRTRNSDEIDISDSEGETNSRLRGYRDRNDRGGTRSNAGKELFSSGSNRKGGGGLHSDKIDLFPSKFSDGDTSMAVEPANAGSRPFSDPANSRANAAAAKRLKADLLSAAQTSPRSHHRRSHAMDAKNAEDLSERFGRKSISIDSTKSFTNGTNSGVELFPSDANGGGGGGLSIKGSGGLSIKGRAQVKELFPNQYERGSRNDKKADLFDAPVRENRVRRRAGDLFD
ncbi:hypothetical protein LTR10_022994 [Elasticomyces elasticus]|uniref:RRM domain-containing protein n=1 Tax=Exophiala sideris TaxID=1016849 RepID=A0ABR0JLH0_9EURO|nr:hypothetical protein LTR10_022994 [Elasticomyces elasticus]KAK5036452.1 hypothetical protein LTS07_002179 [Exophiala sideris]KAK5041719.1 hypothetical protein LTR13_002386 [Exophiala sideris]KAK5066835.1 hypothetical protein LTR69_002183 [Exophiala sideris]KAK5184894.1 hypothetical protein LTR44_002740 [Eurotiomycetes sp. CCFEE 6388]